MPNIIISESSNRVNALYGNVQTPIASFLTKRAEAFEQNAIYSKIFRKASSTHWAESYGGLTAMDDFELTPENGEYPTNGFEEGYLKTIYNYTWKSQFAISQEMMEDQQIGKITQRPNAFMTAYERTKERFFARLLGAAIQGKTTLGIKGTQVSVAAADGKALFATDHKGKVSGAAICNAYSDAFSEGALGKLMTKMQNVEGDNGEILGMTPDTIIIPNLAELKKSVFAAIGSYQVPGSSNNDFNYQFGNWNVIIWPYLNNFLGSETAPWIIMDSGFNQQCDGAICQERTPLTVRSDLADNDANVWKGRARFGGGFADFRVMFAGGISTGSSL